VAVRGWGKEWGHAVSLSARVKSRVVMISGEIGLDLSGFACFPGVQGSKACINDISIIEFIVEAEVELACPLVLSPAATTATRRSIERQ
jgi:hypothetical protein